MFYIFFIAIIAHITLENLSRNKGFITCNSVLSNDELSYSKTRYVDPVQKIVI